MSKEQLELSREIDLEKLSKDSKTYPIEASSSECSAIAKRFGVPSIGFLNGEIHIAATSKRILASGVVRAQLVRECVASLEEMDETIDDTFEVEFLRDAVAAAAVDETEEDWTAPEIHVGSVFDLGELLVQQLSLAMAPFPRKKGAVSLADAYGSGAESSPFAVLQGKIKKTD